MRRTRAPERGSSHDIQSCKRRPNAATTLVLEESCTSTKPPHPVTAELRVHEWGLNPLFWSYLKLFARDVCSLGTLDGIDDSHVLHGKAVQRVEVSGVVVNIKPGQTKSFGGYVKYILDDGTGLVSCTQYERDSRTGEVHQGHAEGHEIGEFLIVQGKMKRFRGAREVLICSARKPADPNEETLRWLQCVELSKTVYKPPFQRGAYIDEELILRSGQVSVSSCECGATYAECLGYCRCVAQRLKCDPSFEFRDALLTHLAAKENSLSDGEILRFQFARDVRDNPSLQVAAKHVVLKARSASAGIGGKSDNGPEGCGRVSVKHAAATSGGSNRHGERAMPETLLKAKVMELLRAVMFSMHRDGAVHLSDTAEDVYALLSRTKVLQPHVEAACRERSLSLNQENEIIRVLQSTAIFYHVSGLRIRACIRHMKALRRPQDER